MVQKRQKKSWPNFGRTYVWATDRTVFKSHVRLVKLVKTYLQNFLGDRLHEAHQLQRVLSICTCSHTSVRPVPIQGQSLLESESEVEKQQS